MISYVFGKTINTCINHLNDVLKRCIETNIIINWKNVISWLLKRLSWDINIFLRTLKYVNPR